MLPASCTFYRKRRQPVENLFDKYICDNRIIISCRTAKKKCFSISDNERRTNIVSYNSDIKILFDKMTGLYSKDYKSLANIRLESEMRDKAYFILEIMATGRIPDLFFGQKGKEISSLLIIMRIIEHYINAEKLFFKLKHLYEEACSRQRPDLSAHYIGCLVDICGVNNYEVH